MMRPTPSTDRNIRPLFGFGQIEAEVLDECLVFGLEVTVPSHTVTFRWCFAARIGRCYLSPGHNCWWSQRILGLVVKSLRGFLQLG
jgi:hypothetical protein